MRKTVALIVTAAFIASTNAALAQEQSGACHAGTSSGNAQNQTVSFCDEVVPGNIVRPDGPNSRLAQQHHGPSLIRWRPHFVNEMLKSVESM
jgi:hypothetical protein